MVLFPGCIQVATLKVLTNGTSKKKGEKDISNAHKHVATSEVLREAVTEFSQSQVEFL